MTDIAIRRYSNSFSVYSRFPAIYSALMQLNRSLTHVALNRPVNKYSRFQAPAPKQDEYYIYNKQENRYYYSNALYETVVNILSRSRGCLNHNASEVSVEEITHIPAMGELVTFDNHRLKLVEPDTSPFKFQNEIVDFAMEPNTHHRVFEIQTGRGKTKMALKVGVRFGQRILIVTKAAYVPKWVGDIEENLGIKAGELCVPKTSKQFADLLEIGKCGRMNAIDKNDKTIKVVLISSSILDNWVKNWVDEGSEYHPTEICTLLGIGMIIYDESHQLFRKNYWSFMLLNGPKFLDLSATLQPDDSDNFMKDRYMERFPLKDRYSGLEFNKYIDAYSIYYGIKDRALRKKMNRMSMYNHTDFENKIISVPETMERYFILITKIVQQWYVDIKENDEKAIVFFATKLMCTKYQEFAMKQFPNLKVTRNIEGDVYEDFIKGDLCVSTPGKSGTAIDIPGLILNLVTVAISKRQMNLQILGRLRDLRRDDKFPKAVFMHCTDCRKHMDYLRKRKRMFEGKVRSFRILTSNFMI